eukprot:TRINITY_DN1019_c0_g1_i2.p1 TRINITY_DN1019_c0_g1~~TRINITY_DN1019_c0_g1_i2.p1  ORF type:complete len:147 (-),score=14.85 TRINITY_DN1019_c0_g1_i2:107-547(-)
MCDAVLLLYSDLRLEIMPRIKAKAFFLDGYTVGQKCEYELPDLWFDGTDWEWEEIELTNAWSCILERIGYILKEGESGKALYGDLVLETKTKSDLRWCKSFFADFRKFLNSRYISDETWQAKVKEWKLKFSRVIPNDRNTFSMTPL